MRILVLDTRIIQNKLQCSSIRKQEVSIKPNLKYGYKMALKYKHLGNIRMYIDYLQDT